MPIEPPGREKRPTGSGLGIWILGCFVVAALMYFISLPMAGAENCGDSCSSDAQIHAVRLLALGLFFTGLVLAMVEALRR